MHDPVVVYAMVTALIVALAVGVFFATPLRRLLTGPDYLSRSRPNRAMSRRSHLSRL